MAADIPHPAFKEYATETVPQAPVGTPGTDGQLKLVFAADDEGQTRMVRDYARAPFHVGRTLDHDPHPDAATVYIQSPTGGIAQGDRHSLEISTAEDAIAHVSTASRTRVLSMDRNYASASVSLQVGAGSHLEYLPEPTILNADARYYQDTTVHITPGSSAVFADVIVPGRLAHGECFDFERYISQLHVRDENGLLFADTTELNPAKDNPAALGVLGEYVVYGSLYVITPNSNSENAPGPVETATNSADVCSDPASLRDALHDRMTACAAQSGVTTLPNDTGVLVRALGHCPDQVTDALYAAWERARTSLLGVSTPESRKY